MMTGTTGMTKSPAASGGKATYNDRIKVLMDYTLMRASTVGNPTVLKQSKRKVWPMTPTTDVESVSLSGMAELQNDMECDECGALLTKGQTVAGKVILTVGFVSGGRGSFFWPTCIGCFAADKGGYLSAAIVALVMGT